MLIIIIVSCIHVFINVFYTRVTLHVINFFAILLHIPFFNVCNFSFVKEMHWF